MKSMGSHEMLGKQMESLEIDKLTTSWDRAKVSRGAGTQMVQARFPNIRPLKAMKSHEIIGKHLQSM